MSINQLYSVANEFLRNNFDGMELIVPIEINGRLKKSLGQFSHYKAPNRPISVQLSRRLIEEYTFEEILDVLKHELVHYALYMQGKPNADGHPVFESTLSKLNISSTNTIKAKGKIEVYECDCQKHTSIRKLDGHKIYKGSNYTCKKCKSSLRYVGQEYI